MILSACDQRTPALRAAQVSFVRHRVHAEQASFGALYAEKQSNAAEAMEELVTPIPIDIEEWTGETPNRGEAGDQRRLAMPKERTKLDRTCTGRGAPTITVGARKTPNEAFLERELLLLRRARGNSNPQPTDSKFYDFESMGLFNVLLGLF